MEQLIAELEHIALLLQKAQTNLKKCPKQRLTKGYIETRLKTIEEYWNKFTTAHHNLVRTVPKEKKSEISYFANEDYFVIEDLYLILQGDLRDLLTTLESKDSGFMHQGQSPTTHVDAQVKLPRIELPTFSGIYEDWPSFQDLFISLVHNNLSLSKVQKLHYLKSSVTGEAENLLKHIQVTDINYDQAWELLSSRYGNKRLIVNSLVKTLLTQKKIPSQTANHIKSLLDTTTECLNSLKNLKISIDDWDPLLIYLMVQKLDCDSHREWEEYAYRDNVDDLPTWNTFVKFLQTKFRTLELITPPPREKSYKSKEHTVHYATTATPQSTKPRSCNICNENHTLCHCREFTKMTPTKRGAYVKSNNLCFNCLAPGHAARDCRLPMSCRICHKRHHSLVHQHMPRNPTKSTNQPDNNNQAHHIYVENPDQSHQDESSNSVNTPLSSHMTTAVSTALLATALVPVKDETGRITMLRALVDLGSQATFISERAAQLLRLKRTPIRGTITGVGSTKTIVKHTAQIELLSRNDDSFKFKVKVYVMSTRLTTQLPSQTIPINSWPHLEGLFL